MCQMDQNLIISYIHTYIHTYFYLLTQVMLRQLKRADVDLKVKNLEFTRFFYKKLGSGHSTKSFLNSHEILSILVLKFS